jgi:hypothetical protein
MALADVALATDCIVTLLAERTERPLFAVETPLNHDQLEASGARRATAALTCVSASAPSARPRFGARA